jgi:hypothetical protein
MGTVILLCSINGDMEQYIQTEDLSIICATARLFPDGILEAFRSLEKAIGDNIAHRPFFGISKPNEKGTIIYKAGVLETKEGEAESYGFETFTLSKGTYLTETLIDWKKRPQSIGEVFQKLLSDPRLDPSSSCVEWYKGQEDVMCMVKLVE